MQSELGKLIADVKENLLYLRELGVSGLSADIDALQAPKQIAPVEERPEPVRAAPPADAAGLAALEAKAGKAETARPATSARSLREKLEGAKLPHRSSPETKPLEISRPPAENMSIKKKTAPEDSLFGDISPTNEHAPSEETLEGIHHAIAGCKLCRVWEGRTQIVNRTGNPKARLMCNGEAPGADEDAQGKPFVGRAGQLLTKIIEAIEMNRDEVFIGNINRCRPPGNRAPMADEATTCKPFLLREIAVVRPKVIVVLG